MAKRNLKLSDSNDEPPVKKKSKQVMVYNYGRAFNLGSYDHEDDREAIEALYNRRLGNQKVNEDVIDAMIKWPEPNYRGKLTTTRGRTKTTVHLVPGNERKFTSYEMPKLAVALEYFPEGDFIDQARIYRIGSQVDLDSNLESFISEMETLGDRPVSFKIRKSCEKTQQVAFEIETGEIVKLGMNDVLSTEIYAFRKLGLEKYIPQMLAHGNEEGFEFLILKNHGMNLYEYVREHDLNIGFPFALALFETLAEFLNSLHSKGYAFNNLMPKHVLLRPNLPAKQLRLEVTMCDFSLTRRLNTFISNEILEVMTPYAAQNSIGGQIECTPLQDYQCLVRLVSYLLQPDAEDFEENIDFPIDASTGSILFDGILSDVWNCAVEDFPRLLDSLPKRLEKLKKWELIFYNHIQVVKMVGENSYGHEEFKFTRVHVAFPAPISPRLKNFYLGDVSLITNNAFLFFGIVTSQSRSDREKIISGPLFKLVENNLPECSLVKALLPHLNRTKKLLEQKFNIAFKFQTFPTMWGDPKIALGINPTEAFTLFRFWSHHGLTTCARQPYDIWKSAIKNKNWNTIRRRVDRKYIHP